jgi:prepilin-type N-terminal cleavage/methylation domain-containing protein/prepilin-type processing-associated H-X9-DG protein
MRASLTRRRRSAFTLVELLVVTVVVALLAATAVPVLGHAKPKSQLARCGSNMRLWGMATAMYLGDNGDHLPYFGYSSADYSQPFWFQTLIPYVARVREQGAVFQSPPARVFSSTEVWTNEVRKCPGGSYRAPDYYQGLWDPKSSGVNGWNCWIGANFGVYASSLNGPFYYRSLSTTLYPPLSVFRIKKPADAMIYMDTMTHYVYSPVYSSYKFSTDMDGDGKVDSMSSGTTPFNSGRPTVHNGGANVTLMDGHVEWVSFAKLWKVDAGANVVHSFWYMED